MNTVIFGATSPIGLALAHESLLRGDKLLLASRTEADLERITKDLKIRFQKEVPFVTFDAKDTASLKGLLDEIEEKLGPIDRAILVFGDMAGANETLQPESIEHLVSVNYLGASVLAESLAQRMAKRRKGQIAGLSSVAGDRGRGSNYAYGSAKGAFNLFLQGLRNKYFKDGVHVLTVKLGFIDTQMTWGLKTKIPISSPESAAQAILLALDKRKNEVYWPSFWRLIMNAIRVIPEEGFKRLSL